MGGGGGVKPQTNETMQNPISSKIKGVGTRGPTLYICAWARWTCLCLFARIVLLVI